MASTNQILSHLIVAAHVVLGHLSKWTSSDSLHSAVCATPNCDRDSCERFMLIEASLDDLRDAVGDGEAAMELGRTITAELFLKAMRIMLAETFDAPAKEGA